MARQKTVEVTMIDGSKYTVPNSEFELGGVPEAPDSVIGNYIKGSRGPMLKAINTTTSESEFINPKMIVSMKVAYA